MPVVPGSQGPRVQLGVTPDTRQTVPDLDAPDVRLNTPTMGTPQLSSPRLSASTIRPVTNDPAAIRRVELSDRGARQLIQAGQNLGGASDALARAAMAMQVKVNATVVDDALNDAREVARRLTWGSKNEQGALVGGYKNAKGYDAVKRPSGKALDDEVFEEFDAQVKDLAKAKITNADQRFAFERQVSDIANQLRQGAAIHQAEQFDVYHTGVYKASVANQAAEFGMADPTDLAGQREIMSRVESSVATLAAHEGASAQELDLNLRGARGAAVSTLFERVMSEKKYDVAQALLNEWGGKIDANTATKMKLGLDGRVSIQLGEQLAESAWGDWAAPSFQAGDPDRAFNIALGIESNTQHVVDGKVVTGPMTYTGERAVGIAQIMPSTAKEVAQKIGRPELAELAMKPTKEGEAANRVLGKVYFDGLVTQFKGDIPKALAAYNAGPGRLTGWTDSKGVKHEGALKIAARTGTDWREHLPKETQDYLAKAMRSFGSGEGAPRKPTRQELYAAVAKRTSDPDVRKAAEARLDKLFAVAEADEKETHEQAYADALRVVRETGGNINAVPPELRAKVRPDQWDGVQTYGKNIAEGAYVATKPEAYYTAMIAASDPRTSVNQIEAMRPDLSEQDYATVRKQFLETRAPQPGQGPDSLDVSTLDKIVDTRLEYLGVSTSPDKKDKAAIAKLGAIRQFTHQYVLDMQRQTGKKFTDYKALQDVVNQMFTRSQPFKRTWMGMTTSEGNLNVLTANMKDIPVQTRDRVSAELQKHLGRKPTDAEVYQAYYRSQFYAGGSSGR